jgi:hypothetical protein
VGDEIIAYVYMTGSPIMQICTMLEAMSNQHGDHTDQSTYLRCAIAAFLVPADQRPWERSPVTIYRIISHAANTEQAMALLETHEQRKLLPRAKTGEILKRQTYSVFDLPLAPEIKSDDKPLAFVYDSNTKRLWAGIPNQPLLLIARFVVGGPIVQEAIATIVRSVGAMVEQVEDKYGEV